MLARRGVRVMQIIGVETGNPVISFSGEIDMATKDAMGSALQEWAHAGGPLTIDLSEVSFIDSMGITILVEAAHILGDRGCIIVHGAHDAVKRVLDVTGIEAVPNVHVIDCCVRASTREPQQSEYPSGYA
jgi:anti-sigma B factor antagonist